jgi:hypothetical protein
MRLATDVAAMRLGWVWPMICRRLGLGLDKSVSDPHFFQLPLPNAKAILGNCVVLPDPVSPHTITT